MGSQGSTYPESIHTGSAETVLFSSLHHPGQRLRHNVFGARLVQPLGISMLPVMVGTLIGMLEGLPVLAFVYIGFPVALGVASLWTWIQITGQICEIAIHGDKVSIRTVHSASEPREQLPWKLLLNFEAGRDHAVITLGLEDYRLVRSHWEHWPELMMELQKSTFSAAD
ncbi:MAG: hypothetical protein HN774_03460 [Bacteroidetes Order II. Incertae sedis bacterium]|nr:hypothetical protein [Bacteroidetes Order II. bacterium]